MTNLDIDIVEKNNNENIFIDTNIKEIFDKNEKNNMNNYNKENELNEMNQQRYKTKLSLRKKKLSEKISKARKVDYLKNYFSNVSNTFQFDKIIYLNESFTNLISSISTEYKNEEKLKILLIKILNVIEKRCNNFNLKLVENIYQFTSNDLIENNWINNLYKLILIYLKNHEIIELITRILYYSSIFIQQDPPVGNELYDDKEKLNINGYFLSSDKYIDIYNKLFELYLKDENQNIINNMIMFVANIAHEEESNQENLYISGTLKYIIDSVDIEKDDQKTIDIKIWCLSKFDLKEKFDTDLNLTLRIQKIYIDIFLNESKFDLFDNINEKMDFNNIFFNFIRLVENTTYCTQVDFFERLIKSNILEFLMDNINTKDPILLNIIINIFINLTNAETSLLNHLINIGAVKFIANILSDREINSEFHKMSMVAINNLLTDSQLWNKVLFDNGIIKIFCVLLNDKKINPYLFCEICYAIYNVIPFCKDNDLKKIIDEYFMLQSICKGMKNILTFSNKLIELNHCSIFVDFIYILLIKDEYNDDLKEDILIKFASVNGVEIIDQILNMFNEMDLSNFSSEEKEEMNKIINLAEIIKDNTMKL